MVSASLSLDSIDPLEIESRLNAAIARHDILRTVFPARDGTPHPVIRPHQWISLSLTPFGEAAGEEPFDIATGPLFRARLCRSDSGDLSLHLVAHRMIADRDSLVLLSEEIKQACSIPGRAYSEFVQEERERLGSPAFREAIGFWRREQDDKAHAFELRPDVGMNPAPGIPFASQPISLSQDLQRCIRRFASSDAAGLEQVLLAAVAAVLERHAGKEDLLIGLVDRSCRTAYPNTVGPLENILPLRLRFSDSATFRQLLDRIRASVAAARYHADIPFEKVAEELDVEKRPEHSALVQIAFRLDTANSGKSQVEFHPGRDARFHLAFSFANTGAELRGMIEYETALFEGGTVARLAGHIENLLQDALARPDCAISELALLTEAERNQMLHTWNATAAEYPEHACIHELFERQVESTPEAIAAVFEQTALTYGELNRRANRLAHYLIPAGAGPETCVGIALERSLDSVIAILAVLKAGAAYVPLDPAYPPARLDFIVKDSALQTVIDRISLDAAAAEIAVQPDTNPATPVAVGNLAYVIYTSGSTGRPKGVMVTHRGIGNMILAQVRILGLRAEDRVLQFASLNFDASVYEIFIAWLAGASLCLASDADLLPGPPLTATMQRQRITVLVQPPSLLSAMNPEDVPGLRVLVCAGEACPAALVDRWAPGRRMFNAYGPTETTVCATVGECAPGREAPPIGRPIANTRIHILNSHRQPAPIGAPGEIYVGGPGLARGYLNQPELTSEKFIEDPFAPGARLYKTGDLGTYLPSGDIQCLGRIDHQIKIRGFRIEQAEIEAVLEQHPAVEQAVVIAREDRPGEKRLVAYVTSSRCGIRTAAAGLRSHAEQYLPHYMIPSAFVWMDSLPLSATGKLDRQSLPPPGDERPETGARYAAPLTPIEQGVAKIWCDLLGLRDVGTNDHFFHIGGESLLATQVVARIRQEFGVDVPLRSIFDNPTISGLSGSIIDSLTGSEQDEMASLLAEVENSFGDRQ
jgi:amino acid adenylation domain-containing protein